jgi:hypothetical protein
MDKKQARELELRNAPKDKDGKPVQVKADYSAHPETFNADGTFKHKAPPIAGVWHRDPATGALTPPPDVESDGKGGFRPKLVAADGPKLVPAINVVDDTPTPQPPKSGASGGNSA